MQWGRCFDLPHFFASLQSINICTMLVTSESLKQDIEKLTIEQVAIAHKFTKQQQSSRWAINCKSY
ncbi:hypothetical protein N836_12580 [Leptolyngbya sp. Heron Island J]|nr:hypothetical protein N836_12580 [Leptolyngbya sp. Heron Island J]